MQIGEQFSYEAEAQRIYAAIFQGEIPPILRARFVAASQRLDAAADPHELQAYRRALATTADLEALELAARYRRRLPLLTRKFRAMIYLAETLPDHQSYFINDRSRFLVAFATLAWATLASFVKALRGLWLLRGLAHG